MVYKRNRNGNGVPDNDFDTNKLTDTVDQHDSDILDLRTCLDDLQGKEFDKKVCTSLDDSVPVQEKISELVWKTIRIKLIWIILTLAAILSWSMIQQALSKLIDKI